jgi:hypothetical protein
VLHAARFFDSFFLKVSVDHFSQNRYIPIGNAPGGGVDISSFSGKEAWRQKETFLKYRQSKAPRLPRFGGKGDVPAKNKDLTPILLEWNQR